MNTKQAQEVIRAELKSKLTRILSELEQADAILNALQLKGGQADCNIRTACMALNIACHIA